MPDPRELPPIPEIPADFAAPPDDRYRDLGSALGDRRDGSVYVHDPRIRTAVRVALATGRPLLLRGPAGSGKSSLAPFIARVLERRFYWETVTARTQARDLMWRYDALRRLSDAQAQGRAQRVEVLENYVEPRALWWAFDPATAAVRGFDTERWRQVNPAARLEAGPPADPGVGPRENGVVVLIDEIDKADPDVPNNLLECLGSMQFKVEEIDVVVRTASAPLVLITTNDERELPAAFRRRCAVLYLREHKERDLIRIADQHFPRGTTALFRAVAQSLQKFREQADKLGHRAPSTAEYLDAVRACLRLEVAPGDDIWDEIAQVTIEKRERPAADVAAHAATAPAGAATGAEP